MDKLAAIIGEFTLLPLANVKMSILLTSVPVESLRL